MGERMSQRQKGKGKGQDQAKGGYKGKGKVRPQDAGNAVVITTGTNAPEPPKAVAKRAGPKGRAKGVREKADYISCRINGMRRHVGLDGPQVPIHCQA